MIFRKCSSALALLAASAQLLLSGCAIQPMAVNSKTESLKLDDKSVLLLTVDISRKEESRFQLEPRFMRAGLLDAKGSPTDEKMFRLDGDSRIEVSQQKSIYTFRIPVSEGMTGIQQVTGVAAAFPIVAQFILPVGMQIPVANGKVIYLGRLEAVMRPRADNEYRAGPVIPLIDQAASGISGGTFDIKLVDRSDQDVPLIRNTYPALAKLPIETKIVPIPDREYLDRQWAGEDMTGVDPYKGSRKEGVATALPAK